MCCKSYLFFQAFDKVEGELISFCRLDRVLVIFLSYSDLGIVNVLQAFVKVQSILEKCVLQTNHKQCLVYQCQLLKRE